MNKTLSAAELASLEVPAPFASQPVDSAAWTGRASAPLRSSVATIANAIAPPPPMTRATKFARWEKLVRTFPGKISQPVEMEYARYSLSGFVQMVGMQWSPGKTPLEIAANDSVLKHAGLRSAEPLEVCRFFEMDEQAPHYIMCSCHGALNGEQLAERIRIVAGSTEFIAGGHWGNAGYGGAGGAGGHIGNIEIGRAVMIINDTDGVVTLR